MADLLLLENDLFPFFNAVAVHNEALQIWEKFETPEAADNVTPKLDLFQGVQGNFKGKRVVVIGIA